MFLNCDNAEVYMKTFKLVGVDRPLLEVVVPFDVKKGTTLFVDAENGGLFAAWLKTGEHEFETPDDLLPSCTANHMGGAKMSAGRTRVLDAINRHGSRPVKSVVSYLGLNPDTTARHLRFLTSKGLVTRRKCKPNGKTGRKAFTYSITNRGRTVLQAERT